MSSRACARTPHFGSTLRTSTFRLALAYCALFTIGVGVLLGTIYLLTETVLANEVDHVIGIELDALADEYDREGMEGVTAELTRLNETWGRDRAPSICSWTGQLDKLAGNIAAWPFAERATRAVVRVHRGSRARERHGSASRARAHPHAARRLSARRHGGVAAAACFSERFRAATLWGIGAHGAARRVDGLLAQPATARARARGVRRMRAHSRGRSVAATAGIRRER